MRVLGVVTARGGSRGIPRKNVQPLCGRPLLWYTARAALSARRLTRVVLSTDDLEIAAVGRECGLEVPFRRPAHLARDDTPSLAVVQHIVSVFEAQDDRYDAVCILQPTSPLRLAADIDGAVDLLEASGADSVISVVDVGAKHPGRMKIVDADGRLADPPFAGQFLGRRRQELPKLYRTEGSIYLARTQVLCVENSLRGRDCRAWLMPAERACDIDEPLDLFFAEQLLRRRGEIPGGNQREAACAPRLP